MDRSSRFGERFGWPDAAVAACGILGLFIVLFFAPREHPHSAAAEYIPYRQAVDSARAFAQRSGAMHLGDATADASIRYDGTLLNELQRHYGREEAITMLREEDVAAHAWNVEWTGTTDGEDESLGWTRVSLDGRFLGMHVESAAIPRQTYHAGALSELFDGPIPADSLPPNRFQFRLDAPVRGSRLDVRELQTDRIFLDRSDAEKLALHHLRFGRFASVPIRVDSVFASGADGLVTATVRVSAEDETPGRYFWADIEVMPTGTLVDLEPRFVARSDSDDDGMDPEDIREVSTFAAYVLLAILMVVIFFRRLNAKVVDTRTAIRDGLVAAIAASVAMGTQIATDADVSSPMEAVAMVVGMALIGLTGGILVFFMSGAALSMARERWDDKLQTLALVRGLYVRNVPVGKAVLRGVSSGLMLAGVGSLVLLVADDVWLHFSDSGDAYYGESSPGMALLRDIGGMAYWAVFLTFGVVLGMGGLYRGQKGRVLWPLVAIALTLALLQASPWDVRPMPVDYIVGMVMGTLIAVIFWRSDALTTLLAFFVFVLMTSYVPSWSAPSAPEFIDAVMALGVVGALAVVGCIGVLSKTRSSEVPVIVPDYIKELAQQERLKRELELAREVQLSFLPARTPDVHGLDLASICLPANEVGGDYYDFFKMGDGRLGIVVGDVSGKGMQAAFYMTLMKGILQSLNTRLTRPCDILIAANELFRMNAPRGIFMSIIFGVIDLENRTWTSARAGHNPMLIHRAGADGPEEIKPRGAALGLASDPTFSMNIEEATISIAPGDLLLIYTDGITEAMNQRHDLFDETRLDASVARASGLPAADVLSLIIEDVERFTGEAPRHDDMTMVAIRILDHDDA